MTSLHFGWLNKESNFIYILLVVFHSSVHLTNCQIAAKCIFNNGWKDNFKGSDIDFFSLYIYFNISLCLHYCFLNVCWKPVCDPLSGKKKYLFLFIYAARGCILLHPPVSESFPYLAATSPTVTHSSDVNCPGAINGWGQQVSAATLEMEVLSVKRAVVASAPGRTGSRAQRHSGTSQKATTHQRGKLGVWSGGGGSIQGRYVLCIHRKYTAYFYIYREYVCVCGVCAPPGSNVWVQDKQVWSDTFLQLRPHMLLQHCSICIREELWMPGNSSQLHVEKQRPRTPTAVRKQTKRMHDL